MTQALYIGLAIMMGSTAALQVALLGAMSRERGPAEAAWVSLLASVTGLAALLALRALRGSGPALPAPFDRTLALAALAVAAAALLTLALQGLAPYFAVTGLLAIPFLIGASFLGPRLGIALFLSAVIAGQLTGAVLLDHVGAFGAVPRSIDGLRIIGILILLIGVALVRGVR